MCSRALPIFILLSSPGVMPLCLVLTWMLGILRLVCQPLYRLSHLFCTMEQTVNLVHELYKAL